MYQIEISKRACKEFENNRRAHLENKVKEIIAVLREYPYKQNHSLKKLEGRLNGKYSRRINIQHRLI